MTQQVFDWLPPSVTQHVALALLHFLWQGALVAFVLAVILRLICDRVPAGKTDAADRWSPVGTNTRANARYVIACFGLLAMAALPIVNLLVIEPPVDTAASLDSASKATSDRSPGASCDHQRDPTAASMLHGQPAIVAEPMIDAPVPGELDTITAAAAPGEVDPESAEPDEPATVASPWMLSARHLALRWFFWIWLVGVALLSAWHLVGWALSQKLRRGGTTAPEEVLASVRKIARRLGIHGAVAVRQTLKTSAPMVVGWIKPALILPASILTGLAPRELEAVLAHEVAHVRRHDYLVNLIQTAVETLLFYHPAVWWISRRIRSEREFCADDLAVRVCQGSAVYVRSLVAVTEIVRASASHAVAATGGRLLKRVRRILHLTDQASTSAPLARRSALAGVIAVVCVGVALIAVAQNRSTNDMNVHDHSTGTNRTSNADGLSNQEGEAIAEEDGFRIDRTADTPEWQKMIALSYELPQIRSGHGQITLMRVLLEEGDPDTLIQLTGPSLVLPKQGRGGGRYRQIRSGDFVLVAHVNSTRRRQGRDPVEIGTFTHYRPTIWVTVPPPGVPGILGDVILSPFPAKKMGRIVATITSETKQQPRMSQFCVGPLVVGGPYGKTFPFGLDHPCDSGKITAGTYNILLPDFDIKKSRWAVDVSPGDVTRLRFLAHSQQEVEKIEEVHRPETELESQEVRAPKPEDVQHHDDPQGPFAWSRTDKYVPPDFEGFFPDDVEGAKRLDDLFSGKLGRGHSPEELFDAVRRGLRRTTHHKTLILAKIGKDFIWNKQPQHPYAIELMYHAIGSPDGGTRHNAFYHGVSVVQGKTDNILRALMDHYQFDAQRRTVWGIKTYDNVDHVASRLLHLLDRHKELPAETVLAAYEVYYLLTGREPPQPERFKDLGTFFIVFRQRDLTIDGYRSIDQLRQSFEKDFGTENRLIDFACRIHEDSLHQVALIRGVPTRDRLTEQLRQRDGYTFEFERRLTPQWRRQLPEFQQYLPGGEPLDPPSWEEQLKLAKAAYAWNRTDRYVPPDFDGFFPHDVEGGKALDRLYANRDDLTLSDREILDTIRRGLRHTSVSPNLLLGWVHGTFFTWPQNPYAVEIMYHAAGSPDRRGNETGYSAIYLGLSCLHDKPENVLRAMQDVYMDSIDDSRARILWSLKTDREKQFVAQRFLETLDKYEQLPDEKTVVAYEAYKQLTGDAPPNAERFARVGQFVVMFRRKKVASKGQLISRFREEHETTENVIDVTTREHKGEWHGVALVRGVAERDRLIAALLHDERYSADAAMLLTEKMVGEDGFPEFRRYLDQEGADKEDAALPKLVDQVLWWLPEDTETVNVTRSFEIPPRRAEPGPMERSEPGLFVGYCLLWRLGGLGPPELRRSWDAWDSLAGRKVSLALEGARRFRDYHEFGPMHHEGCHILIFEEDADAADEQLLGSLRNAADTVLKIADQEVFVLKGTEKVQPDLYLARPKSRVLMCATSLDYLGEILTRMSTGGGKRALPSDLPEWKHLDWNAPLWAIRRFADDVPGNKQTTGAVFAWKPNGRQVAEFKYLSTDPNAVAKAKQRWVHPETDFRPVVRKGAAGTTLITFPLPEGTLSPIELFVLVFGLHLHR